MKKNIIYLLVATIIMNIIISFIISYSYNRNNAKNIDKSKNIKSSVKKLYDPAIDYNTINTRVTTLENRLVAITPDNYVDIKSYNSSSNVYTAPCDGYLFVYNSNSTYTSYIVFADGSGGPAIGDKGESRNTVFIKKGTKVYVSGSVSAARFYY